MPLLYNGQETGYLLTRKLDYFNRTPINWNTVDSKMQNTVKALTALKHSCDALIDNGDRASEIQFMTTGNNNVIAYQRSHYQQKCLVVLNLGTSQVTTTVSGLQAGEWKLAIDVNNIAAGLTSTAVNFTANQSFTIPAGGYKVYIQGMPLSELMKGDVNNDGEVNVADVTYLIGVILTSDVQSRIDPINDVNGDGEVDVADVNTLIDLILRS